MEIAEKYARLTQWFSSNMDTAETELHYDSPFHLLIAVILSAQCTDKRVNMYTPQIFTRFPEPADLASATFEEVYELIKSISFPNNKAKHLIGMARKLVSDFGGIVPSDPDQLETMPGVGRKTANVVLSVGFGHQRIAVDTHVFRVANRIGLVEAKDVLKTELGLMERIPEERWSRTHHSLIFHGRQCCDARKPKCDICPINTLCEYIHGEK